MKKARICTFIFRVALIIFAVNLFACYPEEEPWLDEIEFGGKQPAKGGVAGIEVTRIDFEVKTRPGQMTKLMWSITLHNDGPTVHNIKAIVEFRNAEGEFLEDDIVTGIYIAQGRSVNVSSYLTVDEETASKVDDATVHLVEER